MTAVALGLTLLEPTASFLSQPRVLRRHEPSRGSSSRTTGFRLKAAVALEDVMIVMNGLPGAMGLEVAAACRIWTAYPKGQDTREFKRESEEKEKKNYRDPYRKPHIENPTLAISALK